MRTDVTSAVVRAPEQTLARADARGDLARIAARRRAR
jgi:hypothetical protein